MGRVVEKYKTKLVKKDLLNNKSYTEAMLNNGYAENTAIKGKANKVIQEAIKEIEAELKESDITVQFVLRRLNEDRELAKKKRDISTMTRVDELIGKYLAMFTEKIEQKTEIYTKEQKTELVTRLQQHFTKLN